MATVQELVEDLAQRFPDDAADLRDALAVLQKQKIGSCDRLAKLSDSQWQRLDLPIGIEALLREEAATVLAPPAPVPEPQPRAPAAAVAAHAAPAARAPPVASKGAPGAGARGPPPPVDDDGEIPLEPYEPPEGLHRRHAGGSSGEGGSQSSSSRQPARKSSLASMELVPPPDLEMLWQHLLEDTLPPDKRFALQDSWEKTPSQTDRYMMFLEYSSYLRKPEVSEEEKAERRKQLEPLMKEFGLRAEEDESGWSSPLMWSLLFAMLFFIGGIVYYATVRPEPLHDLQSL